MVEGAGDDGFIRDRKTVLAHKALLEMELDDTAYPDAVLENPRLLGMLEALEWVLGERSVLIEGDRSFEGRAIPVSTVRFNKSKELEKGI